MQVLKLETKSFLQMAKKNAKFDNDINMKLSWQKGAIRKKRKPEKSMPIDFIDQLSKFEKSPIGIRMPFVISGVSEGSKYRFRIKDLVLALNGQKSLMK
jgi:hypothetical protein